MAFYSANRPNRTLTLHKDSCQFVKRLSVTGCGCGPRGKLGNQEWWCEDHISINSVNEFMNSRFWAVLLCDKCYGFSIG